MAQMKEQINAPETELSDEEIANLSDAEFKNTGNQDAHRNDWAWSQNEEKNNKLEQNEETGIYKNEKLRKLWDNFKCSNIWIIGVPEGGEEEQEIENK